MTELTDWGFWLIQQYNDNATDWISQHRWTLILIAALLLVYWVRGQKRQGKI
jgi:hypothetical protein